MSAWTPSTPSTETSSGLLTLSRTTADVSLSANVCDALDAYLQYNCEEGGDNEGRIPLFSSRSGRPARSTLRDSIYRITRPCEYTRECPHNREIDSCKSSVYNKVSTCPSSVSPHAIHCGSITRHLSENVSEKVVSNQMNVSLDVLEKHYGRRGEQKKSRVTARLLR